MPTLVSFYLSKASISLINSDKGTERERVTDREKEKRKENPEEENEREKERGKE